MPGLVLVADDEEKIARMVASYLEAAGFETVTARDGREALTAFRARGPDLALLDIAMPGIDGLEVARAIRASSDLPIVFLTARAEEADKVLGLELGADDYVTKPFSPRELVARVRAVLRRGRLSDRARDADPPLRRGALEMDFRRRLVLVDGEPRPLTAVQFDILAFLAREPGRVFGRLAILEGASGEAFEGYERTIDAHVKNIRKALGDDSGEPRFIGTVRGVGYRFLEPGAAGPDGA
ncbi:MAG: response regulator transcription factor [Spirochaetaceae bacterium]|nr:response regulator transcription factor [Spirochaetaceae bacterium]